MICIQAVLLEIQWQQLTINELNPVYKQLFFFLNLVYNIRFFCGIYYINIHSLYNNSGRLHWPYRMYLSGLVFK